MSAATQGIFDVVFGVESKKPVEWMQAPERQHAKRRRKQGDKYS